MIEAAKAIEVKHSETPEKTTEIIRDELRRDLADWMTTDRDMVWRPTVELTKEDNQFAAKALVSGVDAEDVEVLVAPELLLIKGQLQRGEPGRRKLLCSIKFPRLVNPDKVHAEMHDGMLAVRAEIAEPAKTSLLLPRAA
jgi:HSP20 family molecular chaperone IbpA